MSTATTSMAMAASTSMAMAASSTMPMSSSTTMASSMDSSDMMAMSDMIMAFFTSTATPLFSALWTPTTTGQYIGTCIFLIAFATIFRGILSLRSTLTSLLAPNHTHNIKYASDDSSLPPSHRGWSFREATVRACLDVILAGISYLLMIAVMTMNVGYFLSVLGGTFLGSFALGGLSASTAYC